MRSLRDLPAVRRLNAPTRAAATRRRRLRKGAAALLVATATMVVLAPSPGSGGPGRAHDDAPSDLSGRHLVSLPADSGIVSAIEGSSRVNVWDERGHALVRHAPAFVPGRSGGLGASASDATHVLVAVTSQDMPALVRHRQPKTHEAAEMTITIDR